MRRHIAAVPAVLWIAVAAASRPKRGDSGVLLLDTAGELQAAWPPAPSSSEGRSLFSAGGDAGVAAAGLVARSAILLEGAAVKTAPREGALNPVVVGYFAIGAAGLSLALCCFVALLAGSSRRRQPQPRRSKKHPETAPSCNGTKEPAAPAAPPESAASAAPPALAAACAAAAAAACGSAGSPGPLVSCASTESPGAAQTAADVQRQASTEVCSQPVAEVRSQITAKATGLADAETGVQSPEVPAIQAIDVDEDSEGEDEGGGCLQS